MTLDTAAAFRAFHEQNPKVLDLFCRFALEARQAGFKRYSIWAIANRVRWHVEIETRSSDGFKLNNNHLSFYARAVEKRYPTLKDFFVKRKAAADQGELFV